MRPVGLGAGSVRPAPPEPPALCGAPPPHEPSPHEPAPHLPPPVLPVLPSPGDVTRAVIQNAVRDAVVAGPATLDARTTATVRLLAAQGCRLWQVDGERRPQGRRERPSVGTPVPQARTVPAGRGPGRPLRQAPAGRGGRGHGAAVPGAGIRRVRAHRAACGRPRA